MWDSLFRRSLVHPDVPADVAVGLGEEERIPGRLRAVSRLLEVGERGFPVALEHLVHQPHVEERLRNARFVLYIPPHRERLFE